jgi:MerR family transcriptional regulator, global nitrogen regulator
MNYKDKSILTISSVEELTGLTARQIRYYEQRKLVIPARTEGGTRKYSINDVEKLIDINSKIIEGHSTYEIRQEERKNEKEMLKEMLKGQINAQFRR